MLDRYRKCDSDMDKFYYILDCKHIFYFPALIDLHINDLRDNKLNILPCVHIYKCFT